MINLKRDQEVIVPVGREWPDKWHPADIQELYKGVKFKFKWIEYKDKWGTCMIPVIEQIEDGKSIQEHSSNAGSCGTSSKTLEPSKESPKEC